MAILKREVTFTNSIRPICIPKQVRMWVLHRTAEKTKIAEHGFLRQQGNSCWMGLVRIEYCHHFIEYCHHFIEYCHHFILLNTVDIFNMFDTCRYKLKSGQSPMLREVELTVSTKRSPHLCSCDHPPVHVIYAHQHQHLNLVNIC